ncbi:MAG: hypothetical protein ACO3JL_18605 [Myxococcota bacterium]
MVKATKNKRPGKETASEPAYLRQTRLAYEAGNHAAVRALAAGAETADLDDDSRRQTRRFADMVQTDPQVMVAGVIALFIALAVAALTLRG